MTPSTLHFPDAPLRPARPINSSTNARTYQARALTPSPTLARGDQGRPTFLLSRLASALMHDEIDSFHIFTKASSEKQASESKSRENQTKMVSVERLSKAKATKIGTQFVTQFYKAMNERPDKLIRFYEKAHSSVTWLQPGVRDEPAVGEPEILALLKDVGIISPSTPTKINVKTPGSTDFQPSIGRGVFVQVTGVITRGGGPNPGKREAFSQTFLLLPRTQSPTVSCCCDAMRCGGVPASSLGRAEPPLLWLCSALSLSAFSFSHSVI